jgi:hypothetical protein
MNIFFLYPFLFSNSHPPPPPLGSHKCKFFSPSDRSDGVSSRGSLSRVAVYNLNSVVKGKIVLLPYHNAMKTMWKWWSSSTRFQPLHKMVNEELHAPAEFSFQNFRW